MKNVITIFAVLVVFAATSCINNRNSMRHYSFPDSIIEESTPQQSDQSAFQTNEKSSENVEIIERKIIKQGQIKFETSDVNKTKILVVQTVQELNGYISNDNAYDYSNRLEHRLTIRVPAGKFDYLLAKISENVEKLENKNIDILDVTEEFIDIEARIKTKKELQSKYTELLKKASKVDEILNIEREIGNLQTEIESVEGRMKYLKDRILFSTLTVTYYQKTTSEFGFSSEFTDGIKNGWNNFLWFIVGLSNLWVFIILAVTVVSIIRYWRRKRKNP